MANNKNINKYCGICGSQPISLFKGKILRNKKAKDFNGLICSNCMCRITLGGTWFLLGGVAR